MLTLNREWKGKKYVSKAYHNLTIYVFFLDHWYYIVRTPFSIYAYGENFLNNVTSVTQAYQYRAIDYYIATPPIALTLNSNYC
jgi:hypothetical protein